MPHQNEINCDILIIGTGLSACVAAYTLSKSKPDLNIVMLSAADDPHLTASSWAQGGIVYKHPSEQDTDLVDDICNAGAGISYENAAKKLAQEGPDLVKSILIDQLAVPFEKNDDDFALTEEAAHSFARILYCGDHTGKVIQEHFLKSLNGFDNIKILSQHIAIDLLTPSHHSKNPQDRYLEQACVGAYVFNEKDSSVVKIVAKQTILATGGLGTLYLHTTNPPNAQGDGIAMAYRMGARVMNMEYVQFHPTAFYKKGSQKFLISEALRGEGAKLLNHQGQAFMKHYDERLELAPRDIVARSIQKELIKQNANHVYLDISHKDENWLKQRFPSIYQKCLSEGIDITKEAIPVVPAAHYACGGVYTNLKSQSNIQGLWVVGETACTGLHGANRLASTSLLENIVFAKQCSQSILNSWPVTSKAFQFNCDAIKDWQESDNTEFDDDLLTQDWLSIQHTMWNYVGLFRSEKHLNRAYRIIDALSKDISQFYQDAKLSKSLLGLRNAVTVAKIIIQAARRNKKSMGCHFID